MEKSALKRQERGEIQPLELEFYTPLSKEQLLDALHSNIAVTRTGASIVLARFKEPKVIEALCLQLTIEKKLYCKIAIGEALNGIGEGAVEPLIKLLGKIGNNHEKQIPKKGFYKKSYPLPRDIAARILCRGGSNALGRLYIFVNGNHPSFEIQQCLDVIGHIVFSENSKKNSKQLLVLAEKYAEDLMIQFKITRCLSVFNDQPARQYLINHLQNSDNGLKIEAARSLILLDSGYEFMNNNLPDEVCNFINKFKSICGRNG